MRTVIRAHLLLFALLWLQGQAWAQAGSYPLLWKATSATNVVYLYGTIHVGNQAFYPLHPSVELAFAQSKVVALEADPTNQVNIAAALAQAGYRPPDRIENHISAPLARTLNKALPTLGFPVEAARLMKPYLLSMALSMMEVGKLGYDFRLGLDIHFAQRTQREGKKLVELESMAAQLALFGALSSEVQEAMLKSTLDSIASGAMARDLKDLIGAWKTGDETRLLEAMNRDTRDLPADAREEMMRIFYRGRNEEMARKISEILAGSDPHFVAVGAGHLPGDTGIVALLIRKGFDVSRVR
ncbi:MAG: TraB/GumN family protein [Betaproteobacteria bacterium]|nr:TraB/GumN family protein [Betaproteobacteria bacterium]